FLGAGGPVLWLIGMVIGIMGFIIVERYWFMYLVYPAEMRQHLTYWHALEDPASWAAQSERTALISEAGLQLNRMLALLKGLVALCPLLGLLGTVTGMIQVFDVVAMTGTGNARAMASGISRATIPTMAGMVAAIPGLYFSFQLHQLARRRTDQLADQLRTANGCEDMSA
ncbi:MAG: MotA/TolQ/ExbB proton channel family protein, partial [Saprospiraceae bacterium]|nr:MotA/TolQ/ExbB proton channel family protein [Saprospiraceae bacterium]